MPAIRAFFDVLIDALFPLSEAEQALARLMPEEALGALPRSPRFGMSVAPLPGSRAVFAYKDERVSRLIWNIKNKRSRHAIAIGGYALHATLRETLSEPCILVPIPISARRRRERGYNQCELLIEEIARLDVSGRFTVDLNLLARPQNSTAQKTKDLKGRLANIHGIFAVRENSCDKKKPLIVIDDVITTGSTVKEAIDTLKAAGFADVRGLALAH